MKKWLNAIGVVAVIKEVIWFINHVDYKTNTQLFDPESLLELNINQPLKN